MDQKIFETRQRAQELLDETIAIWRNSNHGESLEGLENDPMYGFLLMALAHQLNRIDAEIDGVKQDVVNSLLNELVPDDILYSSPASAVVSCNLVKDAEKYEILETTEFSVAGSGIKMRPIHKGVLYGIQSYTVQRMDGLRWNVHLDFTQPVKSLSGLSFLIDSREFEDVKVTMNGKEIPLLKSKDAYSLPIFNYLSVNANVYNRKLTIDTTTVYYELFSRHGKCIFWIDSCKETEELETEVSDIDLVFEFRNISDEFKFENRNFMPNVMLLANINFQTATLSRKNPIVKISKNFMYLLVPDDKQMYVSSEVSVRRIQGDRYNKNQLIQLLHSMSDRLNSDFYAFMDAKGSGSRENLRRLNLMLNSFVKELQSNETDYSGLYLTMKRSLSNFDDNTECLVEYLTNDGSAVNGVLRTKPTMSAPACIDSSSVRYIGDIVEAVDPVQNADVAKKLAKYYLISHNRIVTPADIKSFCYVELTGRYGLGDFMIKNIMVGKRKQKDWRDAPYEIFVKITIKNNRFIKKEFLSKLKQIELVMANVIEARSINIYPVKVEIEIIEE